jgi:sugar lactone lactonase YvrE/enterochelin esterase-like enzyme
MQHSFSVSRPCRLTRLLALTCLLGIVHIKAATSYPLTPDSLEPAPGVPRGAVTKLPPFANSKIFPGTTRDWWLYVPKQYDGSKPAAVMVFQDGGGYVSRTNGNYRVPNVFDHLIHRSEMPLTIGVFVNPGVLPAPHTNAQPRFNRSFEYDSMGDRYARFLLEELLPEVAKSHNLSQNPNDRAIAGASSGAICAWTAAWERPDAFRRVFSTIGTYVGLRGGNDYPTLIRKTEPKPIRVFLQDGSADNDGYGGNWWVANQDMLSALEFSGYDVRYAWGDGGHNGQHGGAIFPDAMRWLWRDPGTTIRASTTTRNQTLSQLLIPGEDWQLVSEGHRFTEGPTANARGEVFFTDIPNNRIHKVALDGKVSVFAEDTGGANGLTFAPDGFLYACANGKKQLIRYDESATAQAVLEDAPANDCVSLPVGGYYTDPDNKKVWRVEADGERRVVDTGITFPNGVVASADHTLLFVADTRSQWVYSFQITPTGDLAHKQPYFHLHIPDPATDSGADGMRVDRVGRLYVTTRMGLQICDQPGRVNAILPKPHAAWLSNVAFGGPAFDTLYITCGDKVFKRKTKTKGLLSWQAPVMPPRPGL